MTSRVPIDPKLLHWALERCGKHPAMFAKRMPGLEQWMAGELSPTLKQLEAFARATYTPVGFFFLPEPPEEQIPIPDFRTMESPRYARPSADLLDTIYICQQRQEWYRDFERSIKSTPLPFVGSASTTDDVIKAAAEIRGTLRFDLEERTRMRTWADALREFIALADAQGVLVMVSGIVGSNTHRKLDPQEFRGFALTDDLAPLVFINGADTKSAQMFTLAHELGHIWLGESAVSDAQAVLTQDHAVEEWCNQVAAEILVPLDILADQYDGQRDLGEEVNRLARMFKVSTLVILRRIHDAGGLTRQELWDEYQRELKRLLSIIRGPGGDFYRTLPARVSKRFARALVISTLEGRTLHRDAYRMLGFSKHSTFSDLAQRLGVM